MKKRLLVLGSTAFVSASSFADNTAITTAINEAVTTGQSNYGLVVVGLIGLALTILRISWSIPTL